MLSGGELARWLIERHGLEPGRFVVDTTADTTTGTTAGTTADSAADIAVETEDDIAADVADKSQPGNVPPFLERIDSYDGRIRYVDTQIRRLHAAVEGGRNRSATLWIITADHGEGLGAHGYLGHSMQIYQEQLHVPLIFHFSNGDFSGRVVRHLVRLVDILPTLTELLGEDAALMGERFGHMEGRSMLPLLQGRAEAFPVEYSFAERCPLPPGRQKSRWQGGGVYSLHDLRYKYIRRTSGEDEFFDLARDPGELLNRISENPPAMAEMTARLAARAPAVRAAHERLSDRPADESHRKELEALGYVE